MGLFVAVGVGLGLSGYISISTMNQMFVEEAGSEFGAQLGQTFVALVALQSAFVVFFLGSVVASISATSISAEAESIKESVLANGVASFIGFYLMVGVALVIMLAALGSGDPSGGGGGGQPAVQIGDVIGPIVQVGIPTALVGTAAGGILFEM